MASKNEVIQALELLLDSKHDALPSGFNKVRFVENSRAYLSEVSGLQSYNAEDVALVLFKGAVLGLDFLGRECHILTEGTVPQFQTDYKGEKKLTKKYSVRPVLDIYAKNVREGDDFREEINDGRPSIRFVPQPFNNSRIIGTFAVVLFADGGMLYETLTAEETEDIRKHYAKNPKSDTWDKSQGELYKRTALRRLCKHIELDFDADQSVAFESGSSFDFTKEPKPVRNSPFNSPEESEVLTSETDEG